MRVTVLHRNGVAIASGEARVRDHSDDGDVLDAAARVAASRGRKVEKGMTIRVEEKAGSRWRLVRELIA